MESEGWTMSYLLSIALVLSLACYNRSVSAGETSKGAAITAHDLKIHGEDRSYNLYRPALPLGQKVPLMIVLHGGLGNAKSIESGTGMDAVADSGGFIVAYPEGTGGRGLKMRNRRTWNAGECCGPAVKQQSDDVGFIAAMIDDIAAREPVDLRRVYVTGMSNGAMMAYRLACEIPEKIAAIIPVSGTLAVDDCSKAKDVPVMHIHGDSDTNVPFEGGVGEQSVSTVAHRSVPETMRMVTAPRQCSGSDTVAVSNSVARTSYHCADGGPVELVVIKGGGHAWPGDRRQQGQAAESNAFSASQAAWIFAKQFTKMP
jgi:polyhydroxybutyrate depolymerase